ncbi:MAG: class I SAM-dependent methyltransferase, partial [Alphaproteobacteria bacterium]|nr:class I SAM-dependent methyltransferase [Alphaproteobacteria bacterium]
MSDTCELCNRAALEPVYKPEKSTRGLTVYLCGACGLLQSMPRIDRAERAPAAVSGGADWGNVRYGKGFRTQIALDAVKAHVDTSRDFTLLDVGSNRGSFARAFLAAAPNAHLVAVEPDERVAASCAGMPRTQLIQARIEAVALETRRFDVVHSCHTIEHLAHPMHTLADHHRTLKDGGILVLDAPNTALLGSDDIIEEWFIDKHLYHFSARTLTRMIEAAGFTILQTPDPKDRSNLFFVAKKNGKKPAQHVASDLLEVEYAQDLMAI